MAERSEPGNASLWALAVIATSAFALSTGVLAGIGTACIVGAGASLGVGIDTPLGAESVCVIVLGLLGAVLAAIVREISGWRSGPVVPWLVRVPFSSLGFAIVTVPASLAIGQGHASALAWLGAVVLGLAVAAGAVTRRISAR
jgi:hypothetical protein